MDDLINVACVFFGALLLITSWPIYDRLKRQLPRVVDYRRLRDFRFFVHGLQLVVIGLALAQFVTSFFPPIQAIDDWHWWSHPVWFILLMLIIRESRYPNDAYTRELELRQQHSVQL